MLKAKRIGGGHANGRDELERRKRIDWIKEELGNMNVGDTSCSSLETTGISLQKMVLEDSFAEKDTLVQRLFTTIQNLYSVFSSMTPRLKEQNKASLSRFLAQATTIKPPVFPSLQLKEVETIRLSLESSDKGLNSVSHNVNLAAKSRDPRLRFANSDAGPRNLNQSLSAVGSDESTSKLLGMKRRRNEQISAEIVPCQEESRKVRRKPRDPRDPCHSLHYNALEGVAAVSDASSDVKHLFEGFDDLKKAAIQGERGRRLEEQRKMFAVRKLCLVLDLDHTLLNSAKFVEIDPVHEEMLRTNEVQDCRKSQRHLFRLPHMQIWTKLRPGIWNFLEKASKLYELHLCTMGNKYYATEMVKLLDPKGELFSGRVISLGEDGEPSDGDDRVPKSKDLKGVLGMESAVVIIDDSAQVWPRNKLNLIVVERYIYFPCSRWQFGLSRPSFLELRRDESQKNGTLPSFLAVIERIHHNFFAHQSFDEVDVRNILAAEQRKILAGCRIVFSRVFRVGEDPLHPLWVKAEQFGAVCTNQIDEQVTHVVANSLSTEKVNWALSTGRFVVRPDWVEASAFLYRRANEHEYALEQPYHHCSSIR